LFSIARKDMDLPRIQWYPGHIAKAQRVLKERLAVVDMVIEIADSRIPESSRFPEAKRLIGAKPTVLVLAKPDLAEHGATVTWAKKLGAVVVDGRSGQGIGGVKKRLGDLKAQVDAKMKARGRLPRAARVMVIGLPNVGKSSFINRLAGKRKAPTGDKPGITRAPGWIRLGGDLELLDTPGLISPRLDDPLVSFKMVLVGAVSDEAYDPQEVARVALSWVGRDYPEGLAAYARDERMPEFAVSAESLEALAEARKWLNQGRPDLQRAARTFIHDLQDGALGPMSWDSLTQ
jgi:ribosome biogenesis GTPase A